jgi:hypothetical protein
VPLDPHGKALADVACPLLILEIFRGITYGHRKRLGFDDAWLMPPQFIVMIQHMFVIILQVFIP